MLGNGHAWESKHSEVNSVDVDWSLLFQFYLFDVSLRRDDSSRNTVNLVLMKKELCALLLF